MQRSLTTILGATVLVVGLGVVGFYIMRDLGSGTGDGAATSTLKEIGGITFEGDGVSIEQVPTETTGPKPDLDRPVTIPASVSREAATLFRKRIATVIEGLNQNPGDIVLWLELGIRRQEIQDYAGASEIYEYVTRLVPTDSTAYNNLGNLYHFYLKDFAKSEQYFLKAIELEPTQALYYSNLHDLYALSYTQKGTKAPEILKQGIARNPEAVDLYIKLAAYYKDRGNRKDAKLYYERALDLAIKQGNSPLREAIGKELANL